MSAERGGAIHLASISENQYQSRRAMNAYMAAYAQGDQQIRSVVPVPVMDYQRRTLATTTAALPLQHALAQSAEKS
jgi:hypothetical protein